MNNILQQIYTNVETTNKTVVSTNASLQKLLKLEQMEFKREQKARATKERDRRREKQAAARKSGDSKSLLGKLSKKEQKKEKKSIMDMLMGALGGIGKSIMGILGSIGTVIGGALTSAFASLGLGAILAKAIVGLLPVLVAALKGGLIAGAVVGVTKTASSTKEAMYQQVGGLGTTRGGVRFGLQDVNKEKEKFLAFANANNVPDNVKIARIRKFEEVEESMRQAKSANDEIFRIQEKLDELEMAGDNAGEEYEKLKAELEEEKENKKKYQEKTTELFAELQISDKDLIQRQIKDGRRDINRLPRGYTKDQFQDRSWTGIATDQWTFNTYGDEAPVQRQTGGLIPTLLEPGEKVFLPGQWGSDIAALNDAIPRFQTGGIIETSHPNTGSGYGIEGVTDYKGRPAVFSREAAEAWMKMMQESDGQVKGSDITSSKRSREYNAGLNGAVSNSRHLYGEAVDVNSGSPTWTWMKRHGHKYGWQFNNYAGADGWHFDYVGPGAGRAQIDEGADGAQEQAQDKAQGGFSGDEFLKLLGPIGGFISGFAGGLSELFGGMDIAGMIGNAGGAGMGFLSGMFGGAAQAGQQPSGGGDYSHVQASGDYSRDALIKAMDSHGITDKKERAMFLAQMHLESDGFNAREEYSGGHDYYGGGKRYKGRGYIQLTHDYNYKKYGDIIGVDLLNNPDLAADPTNAAKIALAYWDARVNKEAARGGDVSTVTRNIQGGQRHLAERTDLYKHYLQKGYQTGGIVGGVSNMGMAAPADLERLFEATIAHNDALIAYSNADPIVVFEDADPVSVTDNAQPNQDPPTLPNGPSSTQAAEYFYNLNSTGSF